MPLEDLGDELFADMAQGPAGRCVLPRSTRNSEWCVVCLPTFFRGIMVVQSPHRHNVRDRRL